MEKEKTTPLGKSEREEPERFIPDGMLASLKGTCPYYRPNKKVRYAAGFVSLLESLPHKQMLSVIPGLMRHFSRRTYYRVRKGERPLSPSEQQVVLNALKRCGVKEPKDFDAYFEEYDW